jgi:hypothetical protein
MKFKFLLLFLLSSIITIDFNAQINDLSWSDAIDKSSSQKFEKVLVDDKKTIYIIKTAEGEKGIIHLDIIDSLGKVTAQETVDLTCDRLESFSIIKNKLCVFATSYNTSENQDVLSVYQISNNGSLSSTLPLMKIEANGGYHCLFNPTVSANKKFISVVCTHAYIENRSEELTTNLFNSDFTELKSMHSTTSIEGGKRRITVSAVNDNGYTYVIKKHRVKTKTFYDIFTFEALGESHHNHLHAKTNKIADMNFKINQTGALIIAGFYSAPSRKNFEGLFAMEFKESVYPTWTKSYLLNEDIVNTFKSKKEISTYGYGLDRFHIKDLLIDQGGDIVLTAEHHGLIQDKKLGALDYRMGIVVARLNKTGGMKGMTAIISNQIDENNSGHFSSHCLLLNTDKTIVLCNKIGEADEKIKDEKSTGAAVHIEQNAISSSMTNTVSYPLFNPNFNSYLLQPTIYLSGEKTQLIIIESMDQLKYKIGFVHRNGTEK